MPAVSEATVAERRDLPEGIALLARLLALLMLGFFGFGVALALGLPSSRMPLLGATIATTTVIFSVIAADRIRPRTRRHLLLTIFSFSYFVFFVVPVFIFYLGDSGYTPEASPNPIPLTPEVMTTGELAALLSYVMLLVGYAFPLGRLLANVVPQMRREWSSDTVLAVAIVMLPLGWAVYLAGQFHLIPERAGNAVIGAVASSTSFGIALLALAYQRYRSPAALALLAIAIPPTMGFNFFTSSKILFLMPLVMIAIVNVLVTRRLKVWWIVGFLAVMAVFYPVSQVYRDFLTGTGQSAVQVIAKPQRAFNLLTRFTTAFAPADYLLNGIETTARRLDGLAYLSVIVRDTGTRVPFQGGWSLGYIPLGFIPRVIWADKPKFTIGQWVTDNYGYGPQIRSSTGCTWMGELYFNFGWTGIIIGMTLLGVWFRFLQESFLGIDATIPALLAGCAVILALAAGVGGDMLGATNTVILAIAPIVFTHLLVRAITPPPARLPPPL